MAGYPYLLCRYQIASGDEALGDPGQRQFFLENQGQPVPYRRWGSQEADSTIQIMEPTIFGQAGGTIISVLIGIQPGIRTIVGYDNQSRTRTRTQVRDSHIKSAHLVLIPSLGCVGIQDRNNDFCIPARSALKILRSIVRGFIGDEGELYLSYLSDEEAKKAFETWDLTDYQYTVRPLNPISLSDLTNARSEAMKAENIAKETAHLHAPPGGIMHPNLGPIAQTQEMVDAGYGQNGFKGITPDGHLAQVPKPAFHMDKKRNFAEREKPRFVRMIFEHDGDEGGEHALAPLIARAMANFYGA